MKINTIMFKTDDTLQEDDSIVHAAKFMSQHNLRRAFVVDANKKPVGIISTSDMTSKILAEEKDPTTFTVKDLMTTTILSVDQSAEVTQVTVDLEQKGLPSAAVTSEGRMVAVVSLDACIHACLDMLQARTEAAQ